MSLSLCMKQNIQNALYLITLVQFMAFNYCSINMWYIHKYTYYTHLPVTYVSIYQKFLNNLS